MNGGPVKCSRTACSEVGLFPHVDLVGNAYCLRCADAINLGALEMRGTSVPVVCVTTYDVVRVLRALRDAPYPFSHSSGPLEEKSIRWDRRQAVAALAVRLLGALPAEEVARRVAMYVFDEKE